MLRVLDGNDSTVFVCIDDSSHIFLIVGTNEISNTPGSKSFRQVSEIRPLKVMKPAITIATVYLETQ